ncbi:hypothetical protein [Tardiphaga robiniae]|nr:hypothetical protein [Tardiphaga robiniae]
MYGWLLLHPVTLDGLDGGTRRDDALTADDVLARVQPLIADTL